MDLVDKFQPDKQIENYQFSMQACIGKGSSGTVYIGRHSQNSNVVAIKAIDMHSLKTDYAWRMLCSEVRIMKRLNHVHVVRMLDVFQTKNNTYIVSEFCNQGDLRTYLRRHRAAITPNVAIAIVSQILSGLAELSSQGIIHRDLKPANILIHEDTFKITDFGFAKKLDNLDDQLMDSLVGTPLYMAPQILNKQQYTSKCDVWSLGLILYELIYGRTPWPAINLVDLVAKMTSTPLTFPDTPQVPTQLKVFMQNCIAFNEKDRMSINDITSNPIFKSYVESHSSNSKATAISGTTANITTENTQQQQQQQQSAENAITNNNHSNSQQQQQPHASKHMRSRTVQLNTLNSNTNTNNTNNTTQTLNQVNIQQDQVKSTIQTTPSTSTPIKGENNNNNNNSELGNQSAVGTASAANTATPTQCQTSKQPSTVVPATTLSQLQQQQQQHKNSGISVENQEQTFAKPRSFSRTSAYPTQFHLSSNTQNQQSSISSPDQTTVSAATTTTATSTTTNYILNNNNNNNNNNPSTPMKHKQSQEQSDANSKSLMQTQYQQDESRCGVLPATATPTKGSTNTQSNIPHHQRMYSAESSKTFTQAQSALQMQTQSSQYQQHSKPTTPARTISIPPLPISPSPSHHQQSSTSYSRSDQKYMNQQQHSQTSRQEISTDSFTVGPKAFCQFLPQNSQYSEQQQQQSSQYSQQQQQQQQHTPSSQPPINRQRHHSQHSFNQIKYPSFITTAQPSSANPSTYEFGQTAANDVSPSLPRKQLNFSPSMATQPPSFGQYPQSTSSNSSTISQRFQQQQQQQSTQPQQVSQIKPNLCDYSALIQQKIAAFQEEARQFLQNQLENQGNLTPRLTKASTINPGATSSSSQSSMMTNSASTRSRSALPLKDIQQNRFQQQGEQLQQEQQQPQLYHQHSGSSTKSNNNILTPRNSSLSSIIPKPLRETSTNIMPQSQQQQQQLSIPPRTSHLSSQSATKNTSSLQPPNVRGYCNMPTGGVGTAQVSHNNSHNLSNISTTSTIDSSSPTTTSIPNGSSAAATATQQEILVDSIITLVENLNTLRHEIHTNMPNLHSLGSDDFLYEKLVFLLHRHVLSLISGLKCSVFTSDSSAQANYINAKQQQQFISASPLKLESYQEYANTLGFKESSARVQTLHTEILSSAASYWTKVSGNQRFIDEAKRDYFFSKIFNAKCYEYIENEDNTNFYFYLYQLLKTLIKRVYAKLDNSNGSAQNTSDSISFNNMVVANYPAQVVNCLSRLVDYHQLLKLLISLKEDYTSIFRTVNVREQYNQDRVVTPTVFNALKQKMYIYDLIAH